MAELTDVATEVADKVVEETDHIAEASRRISGRDIRLVLAGVGVGAIVGSMIGGFVQDKRLRTKYEELAESEIDQMREHFRAQIIAREEKPALEELQGVVENAGYSTPNKKPDLAVPFEELPPETRNVFEDQAQVAEPIEEGWDYPTELANRIEHQGRKRPYVIHEDEQHELDYNETEFSYYEGDDVVCDSENRIVSNPEAVIGEDFREKFGHGAEDPNVCFVRNDELAADIEVTRWEAMYSVEVQGLEEEVEFESHRKTQFDDDDD
jgi:hypothetical protein